MNPLLAAMSGRHSSHHVVVMLQPTRIPEGLERAHRAAKERQEKVDYVRLREMLEAGRITNALRDEVMDKSADEWWLRAEAAGAPLNSIARVHSELFRGGLKRFGVRKWAQLVDDELPVAVSTGDAYAKVLLALSLASSEMPARGEIGAFRAPMHNAHKFLLAKHLGIPIPDTRGSRVFMSEGWFNLHSFNKRLDRELEFVSDRTFRFFEDRSFAMVSIIRRRIRREIRGWLEDAAGEPGPLRPLVLAELAARRTLKTREELFDYFAPRWEPPQKRVEKYVERWMQDPTFPGGTAGPWDVDDLEQYLVRTDSFFRDDHPRQAELMSLFWRPRLERRRTSREEKREEAERQTFAGTWDGGKLGRVLIREVEEGVFEGEYAYRSGKFRGEVKKQRFVGWWTELPSRKPDRAAGGLELKRSNDGWTLEGESFFGSTGERRARIKMRRLSVDVPVRDLVDSTTERGEKEGTER